MPGLEPTTSRPWLLAILTETMSSPVFEEDDLAVQWCKHLLIEYGDAAVVVAADDDAAAVVVDDVVEAAVVVVVAAAVVVGFAAADVAAVVLVDLPVVCATHLSSAFAFYVLCCCEPNRCCSCVGDDPTKNLFILRKANKFDTFDISFILLNALKNR